MAVKLVIAECRIDADMRAVRQGAGLGLIDLIIVDDVAGERNVAVEENGIGRFCCELADKPPGGRWDW